MYDIYTMSFEEEFCSPDKGRIDLVFPYSVFHFVLSGAGYVNGKRVEGGTAFICFENNRMAYEPDPTAPWHYVYFRVGGNDVRDAFLAHGFSLSLTVLPFDRREALLCVLDLYRTLSACDAEDASAIVANAVLALFPRIDVNHNERGRAAAHAGEIRRYVDANFYKRLTVEDIAARFYLNKNYLRTLFVRHFGVSPKQYLQRARMQRAAFLLASTQESVTLIAGSVGYDDPLLFSRSFKKYYGSSPSDFREEMHQSAKPNE